MTDQGCLGLAQARGMDVSLLKRLIEAHPEATTCLTAQYRMNEFSGGVLLACTLMALLLANSPWAVHFGDFWKTSPSFVLARLERRWANTGL